MIDRDTWIDAALLFGRDHRGRPIADDTEDRMRRAYLLWSEWGHEYAARAEAEIARMRSEAVDSRPLQGIGRGVLIGAGLWALVGLAVIHLLGRA